VRWISELGYPQPADDSESARCCVLQHSWWPRSVPAVHRSLQLRWWDPAVISSTVIASSGLPPERSTRSRVLNAEASARPQMLPVFDTDSSGRPS